jgi:hypothetical protein
MLQTHCNCHYSRYWKWSYANIPGTYIKIFYSFRNWVHLKTNSSLLQQSSNFWGKCLSLASVSSSFCSVRTCCLNLFCVQWQNCCWVVDNVEHFQHLGEFCVSLSVSLAVCLVCLCSDLIWAAAQWVVENPEMISLYKICGGNWFVIEFWFSGVNCI